MDKKRDVFIDYDTKIDIKPVRMRTGTGVAFEAVAVQPEPGTHVGNRIGIETYVHVNGRDRGYVNVYKPLTYRGDGVVTVKIGRQSIPVGTWQKR